MITRVLFGFYEPVIVAVLLCMAWRDVGSSEVVAGTTLQSGCGLAV